MKSLFIQLFVSLGVAFVLMQMQVFFNSDYVTLFLKENLVTLLIALLAINCTTLGIVLTKIRELIDKSGADFSFEKTRKAMIWSINEQIILIGVSLILLLIQDSKWLELHSEFAELTQVLIMACFIFGLMILYDTAKSIFVIIGFKADNQKK